MGGVVEISLADCKRVSELLKDGWDQNPVAAVMDVLKAYNRFVTGDPLGTVRRSPDGMEIAVADGKRGWWLHELDKPNHTPRRIGTDPVIPSWAVIAEVEK